MKAAKKPITIWSASDINADAERTGTKGSPSMTKKVFEPTKRKKETVYFSGSINEMASQLVDVLAKEHCI
jgi:electron transfer flavoprotein alpha/beta subunit